jgi:hypothetical protein
MVPEGIPFRHLSARAKLMYVAVIATTMYLVALIAFHDLNGWSVCPSGILTLGFVAPFMIFAFGFIFPLPLAVILPEFIRDKQEKKQVRRSLIRLSALFALTLSVLITALPFTNIC